MITRYSPLERFHTVDRFNKLMEELWGATNGQPSWFPAVDIVENEKDTKFVADLPGLNEKDVTVELQDNMLTIKGHRETKKDEKTEDYVLCERSYGSFERRFSVGANAKPDAVKAEFKDGVLTVTVPKAEAPKPKKIAVTAK
jgi:HSP20 family protein